MFLIASFLSIQKTKLITCFIITHSFYNSSLQDRIYARFTSRVPDIFRKSSTLLLFYMHKTGFMVVIFFVKSTLSRAQA